VQLKKFSSESIEGTGGKRSTKRDKKGCRRSFGKREGIQVEAIEKRWSQRVCHGKPGEYPLSKMKEIDGKIATGNRARALGPGN